MSTPAHDGFWALTEKEKQVLRLIARGHDAKSSARSLSLSVHTINERLRDARRKMAVSSSREAARTLLEAEGGVPPTNPDLFGDTIIGEDAAAPHGEQEGAPVDGVGQGHRPPRIVIGGFLMTFALAVLALIAPPQVSNPSPWPADTAVVNAEVVETARHWLALLDQSKWDESYQATGTTFRQLNTPQLWAATSERVRPPLGAMLSRTFVGQEAVPTPPHGYQMVKFRTRFAHKADAIETVTLDREDGAWRVAGVTVG